MIASFSRELRVWCYEGNKEYGHICDSTVLGEKLCYNYNTQISRIIQFVWFATGNLNTDMIIIMHAIVYV